MRPALSNDDNWRYHSPVVIFTRTGPVWREHKLGVSTCLPVYTPLGGVWEYLCITIRLPRQSIKSSRGVAHLALFKNTRRPSKLKAEMQAALAAAFAVARWVSVKGSTALEALSVHFGTKNSQLGADGDENGEAVLQKQHTQRPWAMSDTTMRMLFSLYQATTTHCIEWSNHTAGGRHHHTV